MIKQKYNHRKIDEIVYNFIIHAVLNSKSNLRINCSKRTFYLSMQTTFVRETGDEMPVGKKRILDAW